MSFFGNKRLIIVLVGLVLLITVMGFTSRERENLTWPEMFTKDVFSVVQGIFYRPAQAFSGFIQDVKSAYNVYEENRALKASVDQYAQVSSELSILQEENERLREQLQAKSQLHDFQLRFAEVVARNADQWNNVLTIDKGLQHGIKKDMAVITSRGLIGRIESVSNFSSTVELLTDIERSNHISARIYPLTAVGGKTAQAPQTGQTPQVGQTPQTGQSPQTGQTPPQAGQPQQSTQQPVDGVIEEYDPQQRLLIMRKIPVGAKIVPNQPVITSGLGGVVPRGLPIGYVAKVQPDVLGLTQTAYIQTSADFSQINEVFVVERSFVVTPDGQLVPSTQTNGSGQTTAPGTTGTPATSSGGGQ
ncbi:rod shape-determining protein MreC [Brevibacillus migulae]|uniref:rod shape-determining protein MreC n=1 Tax=Brevibacillus migulae TaxID=1644114 RepID=UPI00106E5CE4|nr:rod shape-determining protein MreC [Brevibacillus migulae]